MVIEKKEQTAEERNSPTEMEEDGCGGELSRDDFEQRKRISEEEKADEELAEEDDSAVTEHRRSGIDQMSRSDAESDDQTEEKVPRRGRNGQRTTLS